MSENQMSKSRKLRFPAKLRKRLPFEKMRDPNSDRVFAFNGIEKLSPAERQMVHDILKPYLDDPEVLRMKHYVQHGTVSTYEHCMRVAVRSLQISHFSRKPVNRESLVIGSFLHDFYLYDWHDATSHEGLHGFHHPEAARKNAAERFEINRKEQDMIRSHMWPMTFFHPPKNREAILLTVADKMCSMEETLFMRKRERK